MHIIGGRLKGRRLIAPGSNEIRPTSARLRETLFDVLMNEIHGADVLDGFAGTGAIGLEALSRGAHAVTFVENNENAIKLVLENIRRCEVQAVTNVIGGRVPEVFEDVSKSEFDLMFFDPPYGFDETKIGDILSASLHNLREDGKIIVETTKRNAASSANNVDFVRRVKAGDSALDIYVKKRR
uniref:Methyltransferase n=1 Tax=uncultured marine thaumarchaeote KM3_68_B04 TaxID=1456242 RepID=A0A075HI26_9ARCH|nr:methyltransferase [uncultured marine thaumarchaeote KM3_68_B04]